MSVTGREAVVSEDAKRIIKALIRGLKFTISLLEKVQRGEEV